MSPKRIVIADDHQILRDGIKALLLAMDDVTLVGEAANGSELIDLINRTTTDLILLDIRMPVMDGIEAAKIIRGKGYQMPILVLSMFDDFNFYDALLDIGVNGFLLKESGYNELSIAIKSALEGRAYFSPELMLKLLRSKKQETSIKVTERERELITLICKGFSTNEIAKQLNRSISAVEKARAELLVKTKTPNSTALAVHAIKHNLVNLSDI
ncbi:response regulator [Tenuifilum osseticum]|jgi:DNA-binding NarL/FixJ family response regulator|uniref:response regulator n=1 Tax=Tenuifilum osseticum TaxID=3374723 RepID=UPI0034E430B4